ncbi:MAG TPA: hypothetical protein PLK28_05785 [Candidatus Rifleibacterium sp.]|nr:hypothetical protein [Candidatus Rifleibacterium sp.]HOI90005.1 hypothetical protein [Candidatus Rifleibacterium sp.]
MKPCFAPSFLTGSSNEATRLRVMPKTLKKPSQKDLASASSDDSVSHSFEKATARLLISFQLKGMIITHISEFYLIESHFTGFNTVTKR